jgi:hypothetical protein
LSDQTVRFRAEVREPGSGADYRLYFEYRPRVSSLDKGTVPDWQRSESLVIQGKGSYSLEVRDELFRGMVQKAEEESGMVNASAAQAGIEYRALIVQDGLEIQGNRMTLD